MCTSPERHFVSRFREITQFSQGLRALFTAFTAVLRNTSDNLWYNRLFLLLVLFSFLIFLTAAVPHLVFSSSMGPCHILFYSRLVVSLRCCLWYWSLKASDNLSTRFSMSACVLDEKRRATIEWRGMKVLLVPFQWHYLKWDTMRVDECGVRNEHLRKTADNIDQGDNMDPASELFIISTQQ